jgi:Tol biopolymer transport system component
VLSLVCQIGEVAMPSRTERTAHAEDPGSRSSPARVGIAALLVLATALGVACGHHSTAPNRPGPTGPPYRWLNDSPAWSPSGRYLLYLHYASTLGELDSLGEYQIWRLDTSTGERKFLIAGGQPQWLGTDDAITFSIPWSGGIYAYAIATSQVTPLAVGGAFFDAQTAPDGRTVAFAQPLGQHDGVGVFLVDLVTRAVRPVPARFGGLSRYPAWSPDGSRLAVGHTFDDSGNLNLCVIDTSGNLLRRITENTATGEDDESTWSHDGSWIYWNRHGMAGYAAQTGTWRVHPDGTGKELLIHYGWYPSLAPGDTALAFTKFDSLNVYDIWISDKDGGHQRPLFPQDDSVAAHSPTVATGPKRSGALELRGASAR